MAAEWQVAHVYYYHFVTDVLPRLLWHVVDDPDWSTDDEALVFFDTSPSYEQFARAGLVAMEQIAACGTLR